MPILSNIFKKIGAKHTPQKERVLKEKKHPDSAKRASQGGQKRRRGQNQQGESPKRVRRQKSAPVAGSSIKAERAHGAYGIVIRPHISEKSVSQNTDSKYVFEIENNTNARLVAGAIHDMYGVEVKHVNIIKVPNKKTQMRGKRGIRQRYNKAIITLKKGQQIEVLPH